jgi:plastocyanin
MRRPATWAAMIALVLSLGIGTATAGDREDRSEAVVARTVVTVKMRDNVFRPGTITVLKGTRVRWVNRGSAPHTSTSRTGMWNSGIMTSGDVFSRVFKRAGTFRYVCTLHPTMRGRVVVT